MIIKINGRILTDEEMCYLLLERAILNEDDKVLLKVLKEIDECPDFDEYVDYMRKVYFYPPIRWFACGGIMVGDQVIREGI